MSAKEELMRSPAAEKYGSIELLRFLAAISVVFVHIPTIGVGHIGVDVFFVVSGFVMMLSTERSGDNFLLKRAIRILPTYYFFTLAVFLLALTAPSLLDSTTANPVHLLESMAFVPFDKNGAGHRPILFLGWTLNYEMFFYVLFAVALQIAPRYRAIVTTLLLASVFLICQTAESLPLSAYSEEIVFEFALGMCIYELLILKRKGQALAILLTIFAALYLGANSLDDRFYRFGLASALLVSAVLLWLGSKPLPKLVYLLGGSSYALYLSHPYVIQAFDKVLGWFGRGPLYQLSATVLSIVLVNAVAITVHRVLEVPVTRALRRKFLKRPA
jgi:peptidoglycan/LPS O-acetylase OafA/YrhL